MKEIEEIYMKTQVPFLLEERLLFSFSKKELQELILSTQHEYLKQYLPYKNELSKHMHFQHIHELEKYFIEQYFYYFQG